MTTIDAPRLAKKPGLAHRLYHGETTIDFVGATKRFFAFSGIIILVGVIALGVRGLNFGIDFRGGSAWTVPDPTLSVARAQSTVKGLGLPDAKVQKLGDSIRVQAKPAGDAAARNAKNIEVRDALSKDAGGKEVSVDTVGPSWGKQITNKARNALVVFFLVISAYLAIRFEWRMAAAAIAAVVHDILVTVGIYALVGFEVTPASVIAFLTILGYSLYDTVVVFDKVDENVKGMGGSGRYTYTDIINLSQNQTLMRSLNTSLVAILPILSVLVIGSFVLGATTLEDFGLALFIGLLTGAYSSVGIAAPVLTILKEREGRWKAIRTRLAQRPGASTTGVLSPSMAAAGGLYGGGAAPRPAKPKKGKTAGRPGPSSRIIAAVADVEPEVVERASTVPDDAVPDDAMLDGAVPDDAVPDATPGPRPATSTGARVLVPGGTTATGRPGGAGPVAGKRPGGQPPKPAKKKGKRR